jgi:putative transposase
MPFLVLQVVCSFLLDLLHALRRSEHDQTIQVVLLRQQLRLYERQARRPRPSRWEKVVLATLAARLPNLSQVYLVFTPATLLRWHREIVKRTWTFDNCPKQGRPPVSDVCVEIILRLARETCPGRLLHPGEHGPGAPPPSRRQRWVVGGTLRTADDTDTA